MESRMMRQILMEKENNQKNGNKKEYEPSGKVDRLLLLKKINSLEDREPRQIRNFKNSKEMRAVSRSFADKPRHELKPLVEQLTNTQQYCQLYGSNIAEQPTGQPMGSFLMAHDVDKGLRARMLDWMIEVTSSYKFVPKTYFSSVCLMDRFFKQEEQRLPITKLHITGVVSMLIATKMDEVYPLKVKTVYEKIVHKKIDKKEIVQMQARIAQKLGFLLNSWTFYDLALFKLHQNGQVKNEEAIKALQDLCHLIGKFIVFNYELYSHYSMQTLAEGLLRAACRVYGTEKARLAMGEKEPFEVNKELHTCIELIMDTVKTHKSSFKNLTNIYKFAEEETLTRLLDYIGHC